MEFLRKLPIPKDIKEKFPLSENAKRIKAERDGEIKRIFDGGSDKLLLIIGPCSADRKEPVLDYISWLAEIAEKVREKIVVVPRIYTNKPRTFCEGYMGMAYQPDPLEAPDMLEGLVSIRRLHVETLEKTGLSCADEMLYPENYRYLSDVLSYVTVGARSVENQQHRLTASGLSVPVGMKNPISGSFSVMLNAVMAAKVGHKFIYRGWEVVTKGNPCAHSVLRGFIDNGKHMPNYSKAYLEKLCDEYEKRGADAKIIVDANHSNSGKNCLLQPEICLDVIKSRMSSGRLHKAVAGLMVESYIEDGCQPENGGVYGKSITDPCLGREKTEKLIFDIAEMI